jgi:hypothetical protein
MVAPSFYLDGFHFFRCFSFGRFFERAERFDPESIEPAAKGLDPPLVHRVEPPGTFCAVRDQTRRFEYSEMLGHCWTANVHPFGDLSHRSRTAAQAFQHESTGGIS